MSPMAGEANRMMVANRIWEQGPFDRRAMVADIAFHSSGFIGIGYGGVWDDTQRIPVSTPQLVLLELGYLIN